MLNQQDSLPEEDMEEQNYCKSTEKESEQMMSDEKKNEASLKQAVKQVTKDL